MSGKSRLLVVTQVRGLIRQPYLQRLYSRAVVAVFQVIGKRQQLGTREIAAFPAMRQITAFAAKRDRAFTVEQMSVSLQTAGAVGLRRPLAFPASNRIWIESSRDTPQTS
jgi:hypothetical protein